MDIFEFSSFRIMRFTTQYGATIVILETVKFALDNSITLTSGHLFLCTKIYPYDLIVSHWSRTRKISVFLFVKHFFF